MSETIKHAGLTVRIVHDQNCESPLDNDEGVFITHRKGACTPIGNTPLEQEEHEDIARRIASGELIGLAVYCYEHSGIALSTSRTGQFCDRWDAGQSGYIYVTKKTALDWHGGKILSKAKRAQTIKNLEGIVSEYGRWMNGECYGYVIEDDGTNLDSCWGFIGYEYAEEEAKRAAENCAETRAEERRLAWRAALKEAREARYWLTRGVVTVGVAR